LLLSALQAAGLVAGAAAALAPAAGRDAVVGALQGSLTDLYNDQLRTLRDMGLTDEVRWLQPDLCMMLTAITCKKLGHVHCISCGLLIEREWQRESGRERESNATVQPWVCTQQKQDAYQVVRVCTLMPNMLVMSLRTVFRLSRQHLL
jgi:hypothetical protein